MWIPSWLRNDESKSKWCCQIKKNAAFDNPHHPRFQGSLGARAWRSGSSRLYLGNHVADAHAARQLENRYLSNVSVFSFHMFYVLLYFPTCNMLSWKLQCWSLMIDYVAFWCYSSILFQKISPAKPWQKYSKLLAEGKKSVSVPTELADSSVDQWFNAGSCNGEI